MNFNIVTADSLLCDWERLSFGHKYNYILGNPPFSIIDDVPTEKREEYNKIYESAKGKWCLAHFFVEKSMHHITEDGLICMLLPATFLKNRCADSIKSTMVKKGNVKEIIEFENDSIFYSATIKSILLTLNGEERSFFEYAKTNKINSIHKLKKIEKERLPNSSLLGTYLAQRSYSDVIKKLETFDCKIGDYIKIGLATLADKVFMLNEKGEGEVNGKKYKIEDDLIRKVFRPRKKNGSHITKLFFPYSKENNMKEIPEDVIKEKYPISYEYIQANERKLKKRTYSGEWYAFGRKQGLKADEKKVVFSFYSQKPNFMILEDTTMLIMNGYYISDDIPVKKEVLQKVLNSDVMDFYVKNVCNSISGDSYNYQKGCIGNFSIPSFSEDEEKQIVLMDNNELNAFLIKKYGLPENIFEVSAA